MESQRIHNWTAKRSGAHITIEGVSANGNAVKIAQVEQIDIDQNGPFAIASNGKMHRLAVSTMRNVI